MNLWSTFLDLDKLHESTDEKWWTDQALDELKNKQKSEWTEDDWDTYHYCKNANAERDYYDSLDEDFYDFSPTSTNSWVKMPPAQNNTVANKAYVNKAVAHSSSIYIISTTRTPDLQQPDFCKFEQNGLWYGVIEYADRLTSTTGKFDSLYDAIAAAKKTNRYTDFYIFEYDTLVNKLTLVGKVDKAAKPATPSTNQPARTSTAQSKPIVTIVEDKGKLRALAANGDGKGNPAAFVQFPNALRNKEGQQYEVEELIWTGKFYRTNGVITPINANVTSVAPGQALPAAKSHKASNQVIYKYTNCLTNHISELEDEGDAEDSIEWLENYPELLAVVQAGSYIILKLSEAPESDEVVYWILVYALGSVGESIAENNRYTWSGVDIIISEADFNAALNNNLN